MIRQTTGQAAVKKDDCNKDRRAKKFPGQNRHSNVSALSPIGQRAKVADFVRLTDYIFSTLQQTGPAASRRAKQSCQFDG